ncbi:MAG: HD domain-containing protein, partial [Acidimicrobiales bacterium]
MAVVDPLAEVQVAGTDVEPLIAILESHHPGDDWAMVRSAHELASRAHSGQVRLSGEPYVTHSIAVATIVAELGLDGTSAAAALLHDVVEDTDVTLEQIDEGFGATVAA